MSTRKVATGQEHLERAGSEMLRIRLSGDLLERVAAISEELDVAPGEVVKLAVQRVLGGMAPDLEAELKLYISTTGLGGRRRTHEPGVVDRHLVDMQSAVFSPHGDRHARSDARVRCVPSCGRAGR